MLSRSKETALMVHRDGRGVCEQEPDSAAWPGPAEGLIGILISSHPSYGDVFFSINN